MHIEPDNIPLLRLVGVNPTYAPRQVDPITPVRPVRRDTIELRTGPAAHATAGALSEARKDRLSAIRSNLVAGHTDVPIHFETPPRPASANPFVQAYLQFNASPADLNAAAAERSS